MYKEIKIKTNDVLSLVWKGNELIDWAAGGRGYSLDGEVSESNVNYAYSFDAAVMSPSGIYTVLYTRNKTKGVVLKNGEIIREINRSFYYADVYDFPIVISKLQTGQEVLVHCPNNYCQLDIEDIDSGEILTSSAKRSAGDFFHSRLSVSPSGRWLLSAGWVWHPLDVVGLFDLTASINDPIKLDEPTIEPPEYWEFSSAAFLNDSLVFVSSSDEFLGDEDDKRNDLLGEYHIGLWSLETNTYLSTISCSTPVGELMPINERYVVSFYEHPKLWDMNTGLMVNEWTEIDSGKKNSSITYDEKFPSIAIDEVNKRFAVSCDGYISVVMFD